MELFEALAGRRSIRKFTGDPVPREDIVKIFEAAGLAPSAGNQQMWQFIAVTNRSVVEAMRQAVLDKVDEMLTWPEVAGLTPRIKAVKNYASFFADAPVAIAGLTKPYDNPIDVMVLPKHGLSYQEIHDLRGDPGTQSFGAAMENLILAAYALGYGTCWLTGPLYARVELEKILGVEPPWRLAAVVALGVPAEQPSARPRKPASELYRFVD